MYDWAAGEEVDTASLGDPPAVVQRYKDGAGCDLLAGRPRVATVRFECQPALHSSGGGGMGMEWAIHSVSEPSTCEYKVTVSASTVCEHPRVGPARARVLQGPPDVVRCEPL